MVKSKAAFHALLLAISTTPFLISFSSPFRAAATIASLPETSLDLSVLNQASHALNLIAKKTTPAVVSIAAVKAGELAAKIDSAAFDKEEQLAFGVGSGVIIRSDGIILTNHHVIQNSERVTVYLNEKTKIPATVVGIDPKTDLAVLRLNHLPKAPLPTLDFGDSDQIRVGDWILAVGNPFGLNQSVTSGIVSAVGRGELGMLDIEDFIQTDAAINPGNSGGPLINARGEMIGINTAIFSESGGFMGIGFSIPSKIVKQVVNDIMKNGRVIRGWAGMSAQDLDADLANYFKSKSNEGALISAIEPGGPAARAQLKIGDVITQVGTEKVVSSKQLKILVAKASINSRIPIEVHRQGMPQTISMTVREQPSAKPKHVKQQAGQVGHSKSNRFSNFGLVVQDIPSEFSILFGIPSKVGALIAEVRVGSPAFDAGLARGDIILNANQVEIGNAADFIRTAKKFKERDLSVLYVQRGPHEKIFVPVRNDST